VASIGEEKEEKGNKREQKKRKDLTKEKNTKNELAHNF